MMAGAHRQRVTRADGRTASRISCPALVIDTALDNATGAKTAALADAMRAAYIHLDNLNAETLLGALQR